MPRARLNEIRGLEHQERIDEQLYQDYETEEQKKVSMGYSQCMKRIYDGAQMTFQVKAMN